MGYKENLATGKSVFEDLRGSRGGAVHLVSLPPPQASGMPVHPTPRGESQPPASASADFVSILEEDQRTIEGSPAKNPTSSTQLPLVPFGPSVSVPPPGFQNIQQTSHPCVCSMYVLVSFFYE